MTVDIFWVSVIANVLGLIWSMYREYHIHDLTYRFSQLSMKMVNAIKRVSSVMKSLERTVSEDKALTREKREQILSSVQATEERISALIRDFNHNNANVFNIGDQQSTSSTNIKGAQNIVGSNEIQGGQNYDEGEGQAKHRGQ